MVDRRITAITVRPLTDADRAAISQWRYPGDLALYSPGRDAQHLRAPDHVALVSKSELIGYGTLGEQARVAGGIYEGGRSVVDAGLGLRPDLVGAGLGASALRALMDYAAQQAAVTRCRVTVAAVNGRATQLVLNLGFSETHRFRRASDGREFVQYERLRGLRE